jgi:hypothetical protein
VATLVLAASSLSYSQLKDTSKTKPSAEEGGQVLEVVATGMATDADGATQAAFSQAIEQAVGVLVDAETIVKNDEIVRDQVLTFSKGFIQKFDVIWQGKKDGLYMARIRAQVSVSKLTDKLHDGKITTREVPGELLARQFKFDYKNEDQAGKMFQKILGDFDMTKIVKVEIVGKPETTRDGNSATIHIKVRLSPDQEQWNKIAKDLRLVLSKASTKRAAIAARGNVQMDGDRVIFSGKGGMADYDASNRLKSQLQGDGSLIGLFTGSNMDGSRMEWEVFRVPRQLVEAIAAAGVEESYRVAYVLLDSKGEEVMRTTGLVRFDNSLRWYPALFREQNFFPLQAWWVGPVWSNHIKTRAVLPNEAEIAISQDDLSRVAKVNAFLEKVPAKDEK